MDTKVALEKVRRLYPGVVVQRSWDSGDSVVMELHQGSSSMVCVIDEQGTRLYQPASKNSALKSLAIGAAALGATAVGAMAIGSLAVGALAVGKASIGRLSAGEVRLKKLVVEKLELPEGPPKERP